MKPRAQLLGFTQTVGIVTALLSLARVGLPRWRATLPSRKLRQLIKLLVWINLHRGYPTITQLVFWSSAERDSTWCSKDSVIVKLCSLRKNYVLQSRVNLTVLPMTVWPSQHFIPGVVRTRGLVLVHMSRWIIESRQKHFSCVHTNILMCWYLFYFPIKNNSLRSDNDIDMIWFEVDMNFCSMSTKKCIMCSRLSCWHDDSSCLAKQDFSDVLAMPCSLTRSNVAILSMFFTLLFCAADVSLSAISISTWFVVLSGTMVEVSCHLFGKYDKYFLC